MTRALVAGAVAAAVLVGAPSLATAGDDPIDQARKAAEATAFSGFLAAFQRRGRG